MIVKTRIIFYTLLTICFKTFFFFFPLLSKSERLGGPFAKIKMLGILLKEIFKSTMQFMKRIYMMKVHQLKSMY